MMSQTKCFIFLILFIFIHCDDNLFTFRVDKENLQEPDPNTIALITPFGDTGWSVVTTYDNQVFHRLTFQPYIGFVNWTPDKLRLIYNQAIQTDDESIDELWIMNYDGSNKERISKEGVSSTYPDISPNGQKIVFTEWRENDLAILTCDLNGNNYEEILNSDFRSNGDSCLVWSHCWKSDNEIVFSYAEKNINNWSVGIFNLESTSISYITFLDTLNPYSIKWSPIHDEMIFIGKGYPGTQVWAVNADGTNFRKLSNCFLAWSADWSSDGEEIIFSQLTNGFEDFYTIWVINRNGTDLRQIISKEGDDFLHPVW